MKRNKLLCRLTDKKLWAAAAAFVSGLIMALGGTESTAMRVTGVILQGASVLGYLLTDYACRQRSDPEELGNRQEGEKNEGDR